MKGKFRGWFAGLSMAGKIAAVAVVAVGLTGGIGAVANSCTEATAYANKTAIESVQFDTMSTKDSTLNVGESKVQKPGVEGSNQVTYRVGTKCNKQVSKEAIKTVVKSKSVSEEQLVGSKEVTTETQDVTIPFSNQDVSDSAMDKGTTKIVQSGVNGSKTVTYEVVKIDGQEQSRTQKSEEVSLQPVQQITHIGTKVAQASNCDPNYTPCIPYYSGNALNCPDIGIEVRVIGTDHNRFDGDGDGYGCESY